MIDLRNPRWRRRLRGIVPQTLLALLRRRRDARLRERRRALPPLAGERLARLLADELGIARGATIFIHSSLGALAAQPDADEILAILREAVGPEGTLLAPTYPRLPSYEFLCSGTVFDLRGTASHTGLLSELIRNSPGARRSLHPTKSVAAAGPGAAWLTGAHAASPYAFAAASPYGRLVDAQGIVLGLGVSTKFLSFVHCIEDAMGEAFPVAPYRDELFQAPCIDGDGRPVVVPAYGHDIAKMTGTYRIPEFLSAHVSRAAARDLSIDGRAFFRVEAGRFFGEMRELALAGRTWYPRDAYKPGRR